MMTFPGPNMDPTDWMRTGTQVSMMLWEAQSVMTLRVLGMSGLWAVAPGENDRMLSEKAPAWTEGTMSALTAAMSGKRPEQVIDAAIKPLRRKTRANMRRLTKVGPKLGV